AALSCPRLRSQFVPPESWGTRRRASICSFNSLTESAVDTEVAAIGSLVPSGPKVAKELTDTLLGVPVRPLATALAAFFESSTSRSDREFDRSRTTPMSSPHLSANEGFGWGSGAACAGATAAPRHAHVARTDEARTAAPCFARGCRRRHKGTPSERAPACMFARRNTGEGRC